MRARGRGESETEGGREGVGEIMVHVMSLISKHLS